MDLAREEVLGPGERCHGEILFSGGEAPTMGENLYLPGGFFNPFEKYARPFWIISPR